MASALALPVNEQTLMASGMAYEDSSQGSAAREAVAEGAVAVDSLATFGAAAPDEAEGAAGGGLWGAMEQ